MSRCPHCQADLEDTAPACSDCGILLTDEPSPCRTHPDRPAVARCAVCERLVCSACAKRRSRRFLCPDHASVEVIDGHVDVRKVSDATEAELLRACLENAGIPAWIHNQKDRSFTTNFGPLAPVKVLVPRPYLEDARRVLAEADHAPTALGSACPRCGLALALDQDTCPACDSMGPDDPDGQST